MLTESWFPPHLNIGYKENALTEVRAKASESLRHRALLRKGHKEFHAFRSANIR